MGKKNILIVLGRYLPGYKGGGPGRSIANLVESLGDDYNFYISCYDRDLGDVEPYSDVKINSWNSVGKAKVWYLPPRGYSVKLLKQLYMDKDIVYLCGCFNDYAIKTLLLNRIGKVKIPIIVASMGLFSPLEFQLKYKKKKAFTTVFNILGIFDKVGWSVTSAMELEEIKQQVKADKFYVAQDLPRPVSYTVVDKKKEINKLKIVFLSRIVRKKNLTYAFEILSQIPANIEIEFSIYGPHEDEVYWNECISQASKLPNNVVWTYCGEIDSNKVIDVFRDHHMFLFPTLGENYGHVIQEALAGGCICMLSDQTPWQDLEQENIGYTIKLSEKNVFLENIIKIAYMDHEMFQNRVELAVKYAIKKSNDSDVANGYREMFDQNSM